VSRVECRRAEDAWHLATRFQRLDTTCRGDTQPVQRHHRPLIEAAACVRSGGFGAVTGIQFRQPDGLGRLEGVRSSGRRRSSAGRRC
jgi:hypothetical protein